ncbi:MAG TPA: amidohydrolase family protein [Gemmatimonadaceae bacterium]|nr:amidohydrolase family protein [Gemmatimonadaceae bacterium]
MRGAFRWLSASAIAPALLCASFAHAQTSSRTTVIHTSRALDGRGNTLTDVDITVTDGKITRVGPRSAVPAGVREIDLRGRTVLPGLIDSHVHLTWYFNRQGRYHTNNDGDTPVQSMLAAAANASATLMAGFTTVQSPGSPEDKDLRDWIATQGLPGPRILTSLGQIQGGRTSPDSLRARVERFKAQGADLVKVFASGSIRDGGQQSMTDEQIRAVCDAAKSAGLRSVVHAHSAESLRAVINGGCVQIEHGVFATQTELDMMAARGVYFDPQCSLVFSNYLDNRAKYEGIGNYNAEGFAAMERALPLASAAIRKAHATPRLKLLYGTDAVAGAHGRNAEDLVCRVQSAGEPPMRAIISATSANAEALGLGDRIGALLAGMEADIIAMDGDPIMDITAVRRVSFVMKGGTVYRDDGRAAGRD